MQDWLALEVVLWAVMLVSGPQALIRRVHSDDAMSKYYGALRYHMHALKY